MRTVSLLLLAACLAISGCATRQGGDSTLKPSSTTTGDESPEKLRARIHTELAASYYDLGNISVALE